MTNMEKLISLLPAQFRNKPVLEAILKAKARQMDELDQVYADLGSKRWIDDAEGTQLDKCGEIAGQSRIIPGAILIPFFGFYGQPNATGFKQARLKRRNESYLETSQLGDIEYRKIIKQRIAKNTGRATAEEIKAAFAAIYSAGRIIYEETGNAKIRVSIGRELSYNDIQFAKMANLNIKPGGVKIELGAAFDPDACFGFGRQGFKGFGSGKMAYSLSPNIFI